ncbi:MAG: DNA-binding response regulator [Bacteroidetes bacterium]|jgi:DNA-binding LytR/AlgR family response regulator|nr:DNA-binding response regulator [Bacteroidota bacterium]
MNCLIIEDEPLAAEVLKDYIGQLPGLNLVGICGDVFSATEKLRTSKIDVLFVDINLPKVNGLDFIKTLKGNYHIILTTAYHQYALDGFNLNVVDYLLKPIEFTRFLQAVHKVNERSQSIIVDQQKERPFYFFNVDKKQVKVFADEIVYIESLKDYVKIHTGDKNIVTKFQIGELENFLHEPGFVRIHKSFIVNLEKVTAYNAAEAELGSVKLPIGRTYKGTLDQLIRQKN